MGVSRHAFGPWGVMVFWPSVGLYEISEFFANGVVALVCAYVAIECVFDGFDEEFGAFLVRVDFFVGVVEFEHVFGWVGFCDAFPVGENDVAVFFCVLLEEFIVVIVYI